ncbi:MAG: DNA polymerase III subunit gamma/tau [Thermodesulfobacteriota bacterium]
MSGKNLTSSYRPQTFAQVLGQEGVCSILSRAAALDKLAPAYMFSGTRGVGKTTVARILAKAVNCSQAPAAEPCNECRLCRQITQGISLDVQEVDGASHTGVDHVRKLNEEVGYSPLEGRYKIIIIDEAHMLSKSAFNALLKTLEEPPVHAVFILATTEPHKFPATIVSRCQHFNFKLVPAKDLVRHMGSILQKEDLGWQEQALELLARKAAGSVRDALSMLDQVLALGDKELCAEQVRGILGVARQKSLQDLFQAFADKDCLAVSQLVQELLEQGLDLGFFLQELSAAWRNLFILRQTGEKGAEFLGLPREELQVWQDLASRLSLAQIHAAWQMTLEGQRQVVSSTDPGLALELLLFNVAYLPDLLPLEQGGSSPAQGTNPGQQPAGPAPGQKGQEKAGSQPRSDFKAEPQEEESAALNRQEKQEPGQSKDWKGFLQYLKQASYQEQLPGMHLVQGQVQECKLQIYCPSFWRDRLQAKGGERLLQKAAQEYFQDSLELEVLQEHNHNRAKEANRNLEQRVRQEPVVQRVLQEFQGTILQIKAQGGPKGE